MPAKKTSTRKRLYGTLFFPEPKKPRAPRPRPAQRPLTLQQVMKVIDVIDSLDETPFGARISEKKRVELSRKLDRGVKKLIRALGSKYVPEGGVEWDKQSSIRSLAIKVVKAHRRKL